MGKVKKGPKKGLSDSRKKAAPPKALNPFEIHVNRQKFEVLGRKLKADRGLPGVSRAKALKKVHFCWNKFHLSPYISFTELTIL